MNILKVFQDVNRRFKAILYNNNKVKLTNSDKNSADDNIVAEFFNGMGPVTATEIIKRRIDKQIIAEYDIGELENTGRYYIARVTEVNGSVIHTLLVDKQNGMIRSLYRKPAARVPS